MKGHVPKLDLGYAVISPKLIYSKEISFEQPKTAKTPKRVQYDLPDHIKRRCAEHFKNIEDEKKNNFVKSVRYADSQRGFCFDEETPR